MNICSIVEYFATTQNHGLSKLLAFSSSMLKRTKIKEKTKKPLIESQKGSQYYFYFNVIKGDQRI